MAFGAAILFLGGMTIYSGYKEYEYRNSGDKNKTIGPQVDRSQSSRDPQIEYGVNGYVGDGSVPIVQPSKVRQSLNRGADPWHNRNIRNKGRAYLTPGVDWFPPGREQVGSYDPRNPATHGSMITSLQSRQALNRMQAERPNIVEHPDNREPLLYPQPIAGYISQHTHTNDGGQHSTSMSYDKKARQFHDRHTTVVPTYIDPAEEHILSDNPTETNFWTDAPNSSHGLVINRLNPGRRDLVTAPIKQSRGGPLQTQARLRLVEVNHSV